MGPLHHIRMEDFVLDQERTRARLEEFLGMPMDLVPPDTGAVKKSTPLRYDFTLEPMRRLGYRAC